MDDLQNYKYFSYREKRALYKEYKNIAPRSKIWLSFYYISLIIAVIGITMRGVNIFSEYKNIWIQLVGLISQALFTILSIIESTLLYKRKQAFIKWLNHTKKITT